MNNPQNYYKRLRMQIDLRGRLETPELPDGYSFVSWQFLLQDRHAQVQWRAFRDDLDGQVFSCLSDLAGCRKLMTETAHHAQFCPDATWLVIFQPEPQWPAVDCTTIQGLVRTGAAGSIQNFGVVPEHRGFGLGRAALLRSLHGFRLLGARTASLEVTADNQPAMRLYRSLGFRVTRVLYRAAAGGKILSGSERCPSRREMEPQSVGLRAFLPKPSRALTSSTAVDK